MQEIKFYSILLSRSVENDLGRGVLGRDSLVLRRPGIVHLICKHNIITQKCQKIDQVLENTSMMR